MPSFNIDDENMKTPLRHFRSGLKTGKSVDEWNDGFTPIVQAPGKLSGAPFKSGQKHSVPDYNVQNS